MLSGLVRRFAPCAQCYAAYFVCRNKNVITSITAATSQSPQLGQLFSALLPRTHTHTARRSAMAHNNPFCVSFCWLLCCSVLEVFCSFVPHTQTHQHTRVSQLNKLFIRRSQAAHAISQLTHKSRTALAQLVLRSPKTLTKKRNTRRGNSSVNT